MVKILLWAVHGLRFCASQVYEAMLVLELRPKHCILAGTSGTHSVCVCTIHQNVKLIVLGARLNELICQHITTV